MTKKVALAIAQMKARNPLTQEISQEDLAVNMALNEMRNRKATT